MNTEKTKELLVWLSGVGAVLMAAPVMYRIHEGDLLNPTTYFLWAGLSIITVVVFIRQNRGGHMMMLGYCLSDLLIAIYAYMKSGRASIGKFEWFIVGLSILCWVIYIRCEMVEFRKPKELRNYWPAIVATGSAAIVAGAPLILDSFRHPNRMSYMVCFAYLLVSGFGYFGEKKKDGKFIPKISIVYWLVAIGIIAIRRT